MVSAATDALMAGAGKRDIASLLITSVFAGGFFVLIPVPACLVVFTAGKIAQDPYGFSETVVANSESLVFLGWAVSAATLVPLSDRIGRKRVLYAASFVGLLAAACSLSTQRPELYAASNFFIGFLPPAGQVGILLSMEAAPPNMKGGVVAGLNIMWFGMLAVLAFACGHLTRDLNWRHETALWYSPYAFLWLCGICVVKETSQVGEQSGSANAELRESAFSKLAGEEHRMTMAYTCCVWVGVVLGYYGLTYSSGNLSPDLYMNNILFACVDMVCTVFGALAMERFEPVQVLTCSFVCVAIILACSTCLPVGPALMAGALVGRFFIDVNFLAAYLVLVEHFPRDCRATAMGLANFLGRLAGMGAVQFMLIPQSVALTVMACGCVVAALASSRLPATGK